MLLTDKVVSVNSVLVYVLIRACVVVMVSFLYRSCAVATGCTSWVHRKRGA